MLGTHLLDWKRLEGEVDRARPRLIVVGSSLPLLPYDVSGLKQVGATCGARLVYDAAHVAGIIAGGRFQDPLGDGADILTLSTYKTLNGPVPLTRLSHLGGRAIRN